VIIKSSIGLDYQLSIELLFTSARFIPGHEQNGTTLWVKGEGHAPNAIIGIES